MANETGLDFSDQIMSLENKYQQVRSVLCRVCSFKFVRVS